MELLTEENARWAMHRYHREDEDRAMEAYKLPQHKVAPSSLSVSFDAAEAARYLDALDK